ncbi:MAG: hypothetical protein KGJ90_06260 [Patescibacteria group bacterium]|nr:hypothetical protein [Patescibacteria group bacterium]
MITFNYKGTLNAYAVLLPRGMWTKTAGDAYIFNVTVQIYSSESSYNNGESPLATQSYSMPLSNLAIANGSPMDSIYTWLQTQPDFAPVDLTTQITAVEAQLADLQKIQAAQSSLATIAMSGVTP